MFKFVYVFILFESRATETEVSCLLVHSLSAHSFRAGPGHNQEPGAPSRSPLGAAALRSGCPTLGFWCLGWVCCPDVALGTPLSTEWSLTHGECGLCDIDFLWVSRGHLRRVEGGRWPGQQVLSPGDSGPGGDRKMSTRPSPVSTCVWSTRSPVGPLVAGCGLHLSLDLQALELGMVATGPSRDLSA